MEKAPGIHRDADQLGDLGAIALRHRAETVLRHRRIIGAGRQGTQPSRESDRAGKRGDSVRLGVRRGVAAASPPETSRPGGRMELRIRIESLEGGDCCSLALRGLIGSSEREGKLSAVVIPHPHEDTERLLPDVVEALEGWLADRGKESAELLRGRGPADRPGARPAGHAEGPGSGEQPGRTGALVAPLRAARRGSRPWPAGSVSRFWEPPKAVPAKPPTPERPGLRRAAASGVRRRRATSCSRRAAERQSGFDAGELPDFLAETRDVRDGDWQVAPITDADLQNAGSRSPARPSARC